jgi:hypothetical protein
LTTSGAGAGAAGGGVLQLEQDETNAADSETAQMRTKSFRDDFIIFF